MQLFCLGKNIVVIYTVAALLSLAVSVMSSRPGNYVLHHCLIADLKNT